MDMHRKEKIINICSTEGIRTIDEQRAVAEAERYLLRMGIRYGTTVEEWTKDLLPAHCIPGQVTIQLKYDSPVARIAHKGVRGLKRRYDCRHNDHLLCTDISSSRSSSPSIMLDKLMWWRLD
jgi:hypothetical protein